jgi:signal peptidase II
MPHKDGKTKADVALPPPRHPAISRAMFRFGLIIAALVFVADQISKWIVLGPGRFSPPGCLELGYNCRFIELTPIFDLQMVWNRGVSFGLFRADNDFVRWALVVAMIVIAGFFTRWLATGADRRLTATALGLVIGGAIGNVIDRIRFGAVVDFLDFNGLWFPWVFNVADAAISVGAVLLATDLLFFVEEPGKGTVWSQIRHKFSGTANRPDS